MLVTSAPGEDTLEFYGIVVEGGQFTSRLDLLKVGDAVWLERQVFGFMTVSRFADGEDLCSSAGCCEPGNIWRNFVT